MNVDLSIAIAGERHNRLVNEAAEFRRSRSTRPRNQGRPHRVAAFLKDLAAAAL